MVVEEAVGVKAIIVLPFVIGKNDDPVVMVPVGVAPANMTGIVWVADEVAKYIITYCAAPGFKPLKYNL